MVAENYRYVLKKVEEACARSGRDPKDVTPVSYTHLTLPTILLV